MNDFWRTKSFEEMSYEEWESICDGCAKCCLIKFRETGSGGIRYTNVACKLLDLSTCRCKDYENRLSKVPECIKLTPEFARQIDWLPKTCAYRLIAEGKEAAGEKRFFQSNNAMSSIGIETLNFSIIRA